MILEKITIENFKGIKNPISIKFKPITLLFGQNSIGKSSIIQAINYARQIFVDGEINPDKNNIKEHRVDLGGFKNIVHNQNLDLPIIFEFQLSYSKENPFEEWISKNIDKWAEHSSGDPDLDSETYRNYMKSDMDLESIINSISGSSVYVLPDLYLLGKDIKKVKIKLIIRWNHKFNSPYIELYQMSANGELLFQIYRHEKISVAVKLFVFKNTILPQYFFDYVHKRNAEISKLNTKKNVSLEYDEYNCGKCERNLGENFPNVELLFVENIIQPSILPDPDVPLNIPTSSKYLNYHFDDYKENVKNISFYRQMISMFLTTPIRTLTQIFEGSKHIGPIRELPTRNHLPQAPSNFPRWVSGIAAYDALLHKHTSLKIIQATNKWLSSKAHFNTGYKVEIKCFKQLDTESHLFEVLESGDDFVNKTKDIKEAIKDLPEKVFFQIRDISQGIPLSMQDVGTGISQILPIIVGSIYLKMKFLCIEQPELHIHPALQAVMADLFIEQCADLERREERPAFVVETHSEHLMLRILRRIRNTKENEGSCEYPIHPNDVAVYYLVKDDNITDAIHIPITEDGEFLLPWPNGFFPERAKELFS
jgi:AAA15 family ATPase/GTPase